MNRGFMRWPGFKRKALTLSYDDGVIFDKKLMEILDKHGIKCTFNLNSGRFGEDRRFSREESIALYTNSGHEVAVHGAHHLPLDKVPVAVAMNDVINDRIELERMFGTLIQGVAYSFGTYTDEVVEMLKMCGIKYARHIKSSEGFDVPEDWLRLAPTCGHSNAKLMDLARKFIEDDGGRSYITKKPLLFYLWGHSYSFNDADNWYIIENFAEYMGGRDDIWYATNIDIYRYTEAFDSLEFNAEGSRIYNPSAIDVYIQYYYNEYLIPAGASVEVEPKK